MSTLPNISIIYDGASLAAELRSRLSSLRVAQLASAPAQAELCWHADASSDMPVFAVGHVLSIRLDSHELFEGTLTATEISREEDGRLVYRVRAYDRLDVLRRQSTSAALPARSLADFALQSVTGLELSTSGFADGGLHAYWLPQGRSTFALLRTACTRSGQFFFLDARTLRAFTLSPFEQSGSAVAEGVLGVNTSDNEVAWHEFHKIKLLHNTHANPAQVRVLGNVLADSGTYEASAGSGADELVVPGQVFSSAEQAQAAARALVAASAARACSLQAALLPGRPTLRPGLKFTLLGAPAAEARLSFVLTSVVHILDAQRGYVTELDSTPPTQEQDKLGTSLVSIAKVEALADDGRVRVSFPSYAAESDWLRVVAPGAGAGKGFMMLPDVGDEVLVVSPDGDPSHGIVVGGVWAKAPPDAGIADDRRRRSEWRNTRQRIALDDEDCSLTLESGSGATLLLEEKDATLRSARGRLRLLDGRGSGLELTGSGVKLFSSCPLTIESPGQPLRIRAARIDFEEA